MQTDNARKKIKAFIAEHFLNGDATAELSYETPLLEYGILNSVTIMRLVGFIEDEFGVETGPTDLNGDNFCSIRTIVEYVENL